MLSEGVVTAYTTTLLPTVCSFFFFLPACFDVHCPAASSFLVSVVIYVTHLVKFYARFDSAEMIQLLLLL